MSAPPAPGWVKAPTFYTGLDILGLRNPVQRIGDDLLNGIVTVTPAIRYVGFYCWLLRNYWQQSRQDSNAAFGEYVSLSEFALVVGNRLVDRKTSGLLGATLADELIASQADVFSPQSLVQANVASIYGAIVGQLNLSDRTGSGVPPLVKGRGDVLADAVGASLDLTVLGQQLTSEGPAQQMTRTDLLELGQVAKLDELTPPEKDALLAALLPTEPADAAEARRMATYSLILFLARESDEPPTEWSFFDLASASTPVPNCLRNIRAAWNFYLTRDSLAVVHEQALGEIVAQVQASGGHAESSAVLDSILGSDAQSRILQELELLDESSDLSHLTCNDVWEALMKLTADSKTDGGRLEWDSSKALTELDLIEGCVSAETGIAAMLPVAWMLAVRRNEPALADPQARSLRASGAGFGRMGLRDVIEPAVKRWREDRLPFTSAMAELLHRTIDQHLRIVWSRRASDPTRDAARLVVEGSRWRVRGDFTGGRSINPLHLALRWLRTLGLIGDEGTTEEGNEVLRRTLATLENLA